MTNAGKCLLWLTAMTTASLALTGCDASGGADTASRAAAPAPGATASPHPTHATHPAEPRRTRETQASATPSPVAQVTTTPAEPSLLVVSDGTSIVRVGGREVRFSTTVTDATVSPNGMDLAFVDRLGNIALAHLDGTGLRILTSTDPGVRRAQPTFEDGGSEIVFSERGHDGVWRLKEVAADGHDDLTDGKPDPTLEETASDGGHDTAPSATWSQPSHNDGARSVLVFEHRTSRGVRKVYVADRNQRGFGAYSLLQGRAPAVSPTGDRVAFIGTDGQLHVQTIPMQTVHPHPTQVTWGAHPAGHLAWTPDGRRILFSTTRDVESVSSTVATPGRNPVRVVLRHPGVAATGTLTRPTVGVYSGSDPVSTAVAVSRARFVDGTTVPTDESEGYGISRATHVTLLSTNDPAAAAPAAAIAAGGPVLFLPDGRLDPQVRAEIVRLVQGPRGLRMPENVDIVGTTSAVPVRVETELRGIEGLRLKIHRLAPDTAAADTARSVRGQYATYVVVSKGDLPAIASSVGAENPVLLTDGPTMPSETATRLDRMARHPGTPATVYAVGRDAQAAVRSSWAGKRPFRIVDVGGPDPTGDSLAAVQSLYDAPGRLSVTTTADWRDVLISSMVGPALAVDQQAGLSSAARQWLGAGEAVLRSVYVMGGPADLPRTVGSAVYGDRYAVRQTPTDITG
jgi:hypothetical protein